MISLYSKFINNNYRDDAQFICLDNIYYKIDLDFKLCECLSKLNNNYDIVLNFLGKNNTFILNDITTINIGTNIHKCYRFIDIKDFKPKEKIIISFTYEYLNPHIILSINEFAKYKKEINKIQMQNTHLNKKDIEKYFSSSILLDMRMTLVQEKVAINKNLDFHKEG